jgi:hypothetical protein
MSWQRPNIGSRVNREVHARFWERLGVKLLRATRQTETNDHVRGTSALDRTPEESANCRPGGLAPGAGISVPEKRPFPSSATMLFFPLFLLGRCRNLHERGGGLRDLRLLLFRLLGFTVTTNLTFRHRNSPLKRLAGCEHSITRSAGVSVQSRPIRSISWE